MHYLLLLPAALLQHWKWAIYQCSIWSKSFTSLQNAPLPGNYGWKKNDNFWVLVWTDLPEAAKASRELLKCVCKAEPLYVPGNVIAKQLDILALDSAIVVAIVRIVKGAGTIRNLIAILE